MGNDKFVSDLKPDAEIIISSIAGDLVVEGSIDAAMKVRGDNPRLSVESDGSRVTLSCNGDCDLRVPIGARLHIDSIGGNAKIKVLESPFAINNVGGDLKLRDTASVKLEHVGGDLDLKRINGKAEVSFVGGDLRVLGVREALAAQSVGGDALLKDVAESCTVDSIGGDLVLDIDFNPTAQYEFTVGSDVLIGRITANANVSFVVPEDTEADIQISGVRPQTDGDHDIYIVGEGAARVQFNAIGGELKLADSSFGEDLDEFLDTAIPEDLDELIDARISEQIEVVHDRFQREADRIRREFVRTAERVKQQASRSRPWGFQWDASEKPKRGGFGVDIGSEKAKRETSTEPVTDQERMAILKMVEEKKITVEEAARLLSALEGSD